MFEELLEILWPGGVVLGGGLAIGAALGARLRPAAKFAVRLGMDTADRVQEISAETVERAQDLVAEVRHERAQAPEEERAQREEAQSNRGGRGKPEE